MESGTGANAVVPFFTHLTLYQRKFPLSGSLQTHTKSQHSQR